MCQYSIKVQVKLHEKYIAMTQNNHICSNLALLLLRAILRLRKNPNEKQRKHILPKNKTFNMSILHQN